MRASLTRSPLKRRTGRLRRSLAPRRHPAVAVRPRPLAADEALYLDTGARHAFLPLYARHREAVRVALEAAGLSPRVAESNIGEVFVRLMDGRAQVDRTRPLADTLRTLARSVARGEPEPSPPHDAAPHASHAMGGGRSDGGAHAHGRLPADHAVHGDPRVHLESRRPGDLRAHAHSRPHTIRGGIRCSGV
jgi:hypothetical protein